MSSLLDHGVCLFDATRCADNLPRYASSDLSPARILQNRRFNTGLVALLDLLRQLVDFGENNNRGWKMGNIEFVSCASVNLLDILYSFLALRDFETMSSGLPGSRSRIKTHRISNHSIRLPGLTSTLPSMSIMGLGSSNTADRGDEGEEQWTRACRAVLAVLKRILVVESEAERAVVGQAAA